MITDVFFKRYPHPLLAHVGMTPEVTRFLQQASLVFLEDVAPALYSDVDGVFEVAEQRLARELGASALTKPRARADISCSRFLSGAIQHGETPDGFFKARLSLIELLFREAESVVRGHESQPDLNLRFGILRSRVKPKRKTAEEEALQALMTGIDELNQRFKEARLPFAYHNGLIQRVDDELTSKQIEAPFWSLVGDRKWANVDTDMKEALDRRDSGKSDAAFYALKALESVIKIISDDLHLTRGTERGAADYINNLVSQTNGRFIDVWESDALKSLFKELRNPQGHGPGSAAPLNLTLHQSTFAVENAMTWIKSLVRRSRP